MSLLLSFFYVVFFTGDFFGTPLQAKNQENISEHRHYAGKNVK